MTSLQRESVPGGYVQFAPDGSLLTLNEFKVVDQQIRKRGLNRWSRTINHQSEELSEIVFGPARGFRSVGRCLCQCSFYRRGR